MHPRSPITCLPLVLAAIAWCFPDGRLVAEDGLTDKTILVGQCAALEGPAAGLGSGVNQGLKACFDALNAAGGINGRTLSLVTVNDGYDPDKCIDGTVKLIEEDKVFVLAGYVGTPTVKAALPVIAEKKIPLIGAFTGAMIFRQPVNHYVFNLRASYNDETEVLVEHLSKDLGAAKIAVFYQNDSFGQSGLAGVEKALAKRSLAVAGKGTFERNTLAVKSGLAAVVAAAPDAVIMVGPYKPIAAFVKEARAAGLTVPLATISFVGTENLIKELGDAANGLIISQVVPSPDEVSIPLVKEYQEAMAKSFPGSTPSYVSLEGFATGKLLALGLSKAGAAPTREGLIDALETLASADLGGMAVRMAKDNHQASELVFLTQVAAGKAKAAATLGK